MSRRSISNLDSTISASRCAVLSDNGRVLFSQCHPKIKTQRAISQHIVDFNAITIGDILQKHKKQQELKRIVFL